MNSVRTLATLNLVMVFLLLGTGPISAQSPPPNVYTSISICNLASGAPVVGSAFVTELTLSITNNTTPTVGIQGVELWIPFDESKVVVRDSDGNPVNGTQVQLVQDFFTGGLAVGANEVFSASSSPSVCNDASGNKRACIHLAVSHTGPAVTNRTGRLAIVTWAGVATGPAGLAISPHSILADPNGQPIPVSSTCAPNIVITAPGAVRGTVARQGTGSTRLYCTKVTATDRNSVITQSWTDAGGTFTMTVPVGAYYTVRAQYPGYLHAQKSNVYVVGASVELGTTNLWGGELNSDNCVNILDIVTIISKFGTTTNDANWGGDCASFYATNEAADLNDDGVVNILDLSIAAGNFGRCGPTTWAP